MEPKDYPQVERRTFDDEAHAASHEHLRQIILERLERKRKWDKFNSSFIGAIAVACVAGLSWLGTAIIAWWKS